MNRLLGTISAIEANDHLALVDALVGPDTFTAMLMETPQQAPYLKVGNAVAILFKETEVALAKNFSGQISLRNILHGTVSRIRRGDILCEVVLDYRGQAVTSIITTRAVQRLALEVGDSVTALVKANEVSLTEAQSGI